MGRQDAVCELAYSGAWQTAPLYVRDRTTITRGQGNETGGPTPQTLGGTLDNRTGAYNPRNASSPLYGLVGRNTPLRDGLDLAVDTFGGTSSSGWTPTDGGLPWTGVGAAAADFTESAGIGRHLQPLKNIVRLSLLADERRAVEQVTEASIPAVAVGASAVVGHVARRQASGDFYWLRMEFDTGGAMTAKISRNVGGTFADLAAQSAIPGLTYTAGQSYTLRSSVSGSRLSLRVWPTGTPEPSAWTLTAVDASATLTGPGRYGLASWVVGGNTNTTEVRFDNYRAVDRRFHGEVASWKPGRTTDFNPATGTKGDAWTEVEAAGILRRSGQGDTPSKSALRRTTEATGPLAYWPVEDGIASGQAASVVSGQPPLSVSGPSPEFRKVEDFQDPFDTIRFGTSALADLATGAKLRADSPSAAGATATVWTVGVTAGGLDPANISGDVDLLEWTTPGGTYVKWRLRYLKAATRVQVLGYKADDSEWLFIERIGTNIGFGPRYVSGRQVGADITIDLYELAGATPDETFTAASATLSGISAVAVNASGRTSAVPMPVGHVAMWAAGAPPAVLASAVDAYGALVYGPWASWYNEAATDRLVRVAAEAGVTVEMPPVPAESVIRMGWQPTATLAELIDQCVAVDGGLLYEPRDSLALAYRPRDSLYNQPPVLTVDWSAGQVAPPFAPVVDDLNIRNDVTVKRTDGSSARAVETSGRLAAVPPPDGVGVYETSVEVNPADDARLADLAWWALHKGTVDEARIPRVTVDLVANPGLAAAAAAVDIGDRIVVTGLPADMGDDEVPLLVLGYTEVIGSHTRTITFNAVPASVYDVATVDGTQRVAADGTVTTGLTAVGMSLLISSTPENGPWTEVPTDMPLDVRVGGERVTASGITPAVADVFSRTVSNGWGTANSGQAWTTTGGSASDYAVSSGTGRHAHTSVGVLRQSFIAPGGNRDFTMVADVTFPVMPSGAAFTVWVVIREVDTSNYYAAQLGISPGGATTLTWFKRVGGSLTALASGVNVGTHTAGTTWRISAAISGTVLMAKAWIPPASEPGWQTTATDSAITAGTQVGVLSRLETGNTNTLPVTISVDNFTVTNPQTVTLSARAVNGVTRVWPAGTEVDVWFPAIAAL